MAFTIISLKDWFCPSILKLISITPFVISGVKIKASTIAPVKKASQSACFFKPFLSPSKKPIKTKNKRTRLTIKVISPALIKISFWLF